MKNARSIRKFAQNKQLKQAVEKLPKVEKFREAIAAEPIETIARLAAAAAKNRKRVEGATGLNLMPVDTRTAAIAGVAVKDYTQSASMYMYRPPRRNTPENVVKYVMKRSATDTQIVNKDLVNCFDINILDAKPVENNPDNSSDYSRLTVKRAFDQALSARVADPQQIENSRVAQSSIYVKSLSIDLTITNTYATGTLLDVYELVPQHTLGPSTYSNEGYATGYMSPLWTYQQGLDTTQVLQIDDTLQVSNLAANPMNSTHFTRTWKIVKHLRLNMTSESVHRHKSFYEINKTVSYQEMAQFSDNGGKFAGWNPTFLVMQRGVPITDDQAAAAGLRYSVNMQLNYEATPDRQNKVIVFDSNT